MINNVTLITTVFNEGKNMQRFLESYANQTEFAEEVIIVDGGSEDDTVKVTKRFQQIHPELSITLIVDASCSKKCVTGPIARGRNIAIQAAQSNYIIATDAGCVLDNNWVKNISMPFFNDDADVVSGWYEPLVENKFQQLYARLYMPKIKDVNPGKFLPSSRSIGFKRSCWKKVNGYPETTFTAEDTLFDLNLRKKGFRFHFAADAVVFWECPRNKIETYQKYYSYALGDGQNKLFWRLYVIKTLLLFFPLDILMNPLKRRNSLFTYSVTLHRVKGYLSGILSSFYTRA